MLLDVVCVNERCFDPELRQPLRKKLGDSAINIALRHDVIASLRERKKRSGDRGHPRREKQGGVRAFEFSDGLFGDGAGWIAIARVEAVRWGDAQLLLHVGDFKRRSLIDRGGERTVFFGKVGAAADDLGFLAEFMVFHIAEPRSVRNKDLIKSFEGIGLILVVVPPSPIPAY